jgi:hypothetical protein
MNSCVALCMENPMDLNERKFIGKRFTILQKLFSELIGSRAISIEILVEHVQETKTFLAELDKAYFEDEEIREELWHLLSKHGKRNLNIATALLTQLCEKHIRRNTTRDGRKKPILPPWLMRKSEPN